MFRHLLTMQRLRLGTPALAKAAYLAGSRLQDVHSGAIYKHELRKDVLRRRVLAPSAAEAWCHDREQLGSAVQSPVIDGARVEPVLLLRLALPLTSGPAEQEALAVGIADCFFVARGHAVDLTIHEGEPRHAHLMFSPALVGSAPSGFGRRPRSDHALFLAWPSAWERDCSAFAYPRLLAAGRALHAPA